MGEGTYMLIFITALGENIAVLKYFGSFCHGCSSSRALCSSGSHVYLRDERGDEGRGAKMRKKVGRQVIRNVGFLNEQRNFF